MEFLKPSLSVTIDPGQKTYTVTARVLAPNGCYMSSGAMPGAPAGQVHVPETQPITLRIVRQDGFCTQAIKLMEFSVGGLALSEGISRVLAFAVLDDVVVATASTPVVAWPKKDDDKLRVRKGGAVVTSGAVLVSTNGWISAMPGTPPLLVTVANVWAPCANYQFDFNDMGPFGFTGRTLLVELVATAPKLCQKAIFEGPIRFEKKLKKADELDSVVLAFEGRLHFAELEIAV